MGVAIGEKVVADDTVGLADRLSGKEDAVAVTLTVRDVNGLRERVTEGVTLALRGLEDLDIESEGVTLALRGPADAVFESEGVIEALMGLSDAVLESEGEPLALRGPTDAVFESEGVTLAPRGLGDAVFESEGVTLSVCDEESDCVPAIDCVAVKEGDIDHDDVIEVVAEIVPEKDAEMEGLPVAADATYRVGPAVCILSRITVEGDAGSTWRSTADHVPFSSAFENP